MRLANEKTLELNIIHQLLTEYKKSHTIGTTLLDESKLGFDSLIRTQYTAVIFQFKSANPKKGSDGKEGHFKINNNKAKNQHVNLNKIARRFPQSVFYVFPLVRTDQYFEQNVSDLVSRTIFADVQSLPSYAIGTVHRVIAYDSGMYEAFSTPTKKIGLTGKQFLQKLNKSEIGFKFKGKHQSDLDLVRLLVDLCEESRMSGIALALFHPVKPIIYNIRP